jgi:hypothetical protein
MSVSTITGTGPGAAGAVSAGWDVASDAKRGVIAPAADEIDPAKKNATAKTETGTENSAIEVLARSEHFKPPRDQAGQAAGESTPRL